ncbi:MAG: AraC family transcriptional regulator, partial [Chitinophagaceae bacterium]
SNDKPFQSTIDGVLHEGIHGFLIKPHVPHFCKAETGTLNVFNIEPYSTVGLELAGKFRQDQTNIVFGAINETNTFFQVPDHRANVAGITHALLSGIPTVPHDDRVTKIIDYIREKYFEPDISPQTFTDIVFLSASRLAALFKQQTGSSLSKYLLWTRLRHAIYLTLSDKRRSLTDIAYDTGFYDLPQLNKYMYEMFGMPPTALKQNSDLIEIYQDQPAPLIKQ